MVGPETADLSGGDDLGHYRIERLLGRGGMGEVYLARDRRLDRPVALKLLSQELTADADLRARFLQEARWASSVSHSNIAQIFDVGHDKGRHFIAMEYVAGESLDVVVARGPLEPSAAVAIAHDACAALAVAHEKGILHRDLKPANMRLTESGVLKLLDFGLAKTIGRDEAAPVAVTLRTSPGMLMGTVFYMSPEQALGGDLDRRSDVFSLGVVLYQLTTGQLPFQSSTVTATIDAIVHHAPKRPSDLTPTLPAALDGIIMRAIEKDVARRFQSAGEMGAALHALQLDYEIRKGGTRPRPSLPSAARWLGAAAVVALLAAAATIWRQWPASPAELDISPLTNLPGAEITPALSPDGSLVAYAWNGPQENNFDIYVRQVGGGEALRLTEHPGADTNPVFSRDGRWLAFVRNNTDVYYLPALGGSERKVGPTRFAGIDFAPDGQAIATSGPAPPGKEGVGIRLLPLDGQDAQVITHPPPGSSDIEPRFSPDGRRVAFLRVTGAAIMDVFVQPVSGGDAVRVTKDNVSIEGLGWMAGGRDLVFSSTRAGYGRLYRVDSETGAVRALSVNHGSFYPALALTGSRLAYNYRDQDLNVWRIEIGNAASARVIPVSTGVDASPSVSPDGTRIAFASTRSGRDEIWTSRTDGSDLVQVTDWSGQRAGVVGSPAWSPDGQRIAFDARVAGNADVYVVNTDGSNRLRITDSDALDVVPSWSKDGTWIYFNSRRSGRPEIWKAPATAGAATQVTANGGFSARESPDGTQLFYVRTRTDTAVWQMPVAGGPEQMAMPGPDGKPYTVMQFAYWAPTKDGIYFLERPDASSPGLPSLAFYEFATRVARPIHTLLRPPGIGTGGLSLSPDGRTLFWTQLDRNSNDILLLEGLR